MKNKFFLVLPAVLILGVLIILSYKEDEVKILPSYRMSFMQGLHLTHKEGNKVKWELVAQGATFPEGNEEIIVKSLKLKIYNDPEIYLSGGSGIYKIEDRNLTVNKPVELNIKDTKLTTDVLTWNTKDELITTEDSIKFSGKNFMVEGTRLVTKIKQHKVKILKNVKGSFYR